MGKLETVVRFGYSLGHGQSNNGMLLKADKLTGNDKMATSVAPEIEVRERKNDGEHRVRT